MKYKFMFQRRFYYCRRRDTLPPEPLLTTSCQRRSKGDVTRDDFKQRLLAQHSVAMLEQRCNYSKQYRNNVTTMCCAKNRCCESSRVTSPLLLLQQEEVKKRLWWQGVTTATVVKPSLKHEFVLNLARLSIICIYKAGLHATRFIAKIYL